MVTITHTQVKSLTRQLIDALPRTHNSIALPRNCSPALIIQLITLALAGAEDESAKREAAQIVC